MSYLSYFFIACLIGVVAFAFANQSAIAKQLDDWQLIPRPQHVTELYFTDSLRLPSEVRSGTTQSVSFTIHSSEYRPTTYSYRLTAASRDKGTVQLLHSGEVTLTHDQYKTIDQTVTIPTTESQLTIGVVLEYASEVPDSRMPIRESQSISYRAKVVGATP